MFRIRSLEEHLEPKCDNDRPEGMTLTSDLQEKLSRDLKTIQAELTACNDCWEEAINRTEKAPAKENPTKGAIVL